MNEKSLFQLSYPLLLNALIGMMVVLVDMVIISSYSEDAAAAVSIANQILLVVFDLSALFATGAVVIVARRLGSGDKEGAKQASLSAMTANGVVSCILGFVIWMTAGPLLSAINCPAEIFTKSLIYLQVGAFTILFNGVMMAATATLRGYGETRLILMLGILAYAIYLVSEIVLIFGWGIIPELGVLGSALATLLVRVTAVIALVLVLARRLGIAFLSPFNMKSRLRRARELFALSWPSAIDNFAYGFYQMILVSFIAVQSVEMLLSRTFTLTLTAVLTVVLMAISQANEVLIGFRHGAKRDQDLTASVVQAAAVSTVLTTGIAILLFVFSRPLIGMFSSQPVVQELASQLLLITIFVQPFSAVNTTLFHSLRALGYVFVPVAGTQLMMWGLSVPLAYLLAIKFDLGVIGLWYVLLMEEALKAVFLCLLWHFRRKKLDESSEP